MEYVLSRIDQSEARGDADGNLWVREFKPDYPEGPDLWWVLGADARFLAPVATPEG